MNNVTVRIGLPLAQGRLPLAAEQLDAPVLISASCLWNKKRERFREPGDVMMDLDVALDSAGFTAMQLWGGNHPWTVEQYVALGMSYSWAWWASMDFCCEPEVSAGREETRARIERTAEMLRECRRIATKYRSAAQLDYVLSGLGTISDFDRIAASEYQDPMPVLQGWMVEDYLYSVELTDEVLHGNWPELVGIGSVCRRGAIADIIRIVEALDKALPPHVKLHLFGVKGDALQALRGHPRLGSVDSQSWGNAARWDTCKAGESCTIERKVMAMRKWWADNTGEGVDFEAPIPQDISADVPMSNPHYLDAGEQLGLFGVAA